MVLGLLWFFVYLSKKTWKRFNQYYFEFYITWNGLQNTTWIFFIINTNYILLKLQICLLLLWMLRSLKNVQQTKESRLTHFDSFSTFAVPFIIHFALAMFIIHRIDRDLDLPKNYEYIYSKWDQCSYFLFRNLKKKYWFNFFRSWIKYVTCTFFMTFVSTELLMVFRDSIESLVSENWAKFIEVVSYFIMIFIIRILFHLQVSLEWDIFNNFLMHHQEKKWYFQFNTNYWIYKKYLCISKNFSN